jgi:uncharacterized BrkB/YihY/UPF0761 family membrane protein
VGKIGEVEPFNFNLPRGVHGRDGDHVLPHVFHSLACDTATSLLFALGKLLLGLYLGKASFPSTYGAAASLVVLIIWVYYSGQIFFLGAELTKSFANRYGSRPNVYPSGMVKNGANRAPPSSEAKIVIPPGGH